MKKSRVILLWIVFIVVVNFTFIAYFAIKSKVLTLLLGVLSAIALIAAVAAYVKFSVERKKAAKENRRRAKEAMAKWDAREK